MGKATSFCPCRYRKPVPTFPGHAPADGTRTHAGASGLPIGHFSWTQRAPFRTCGRARLHRDLRHPGPAGKGAAPAVVCIHPDLSIRAGDQRSDHGGLPVRSVQHLPVPGAALARLRLPVHRGHGRDSYADLPGPVLADRPAGRGSADHGMALHVLARRLPAHGHCLRAAPGPGTFGDARLHRRSLERRGGSRRGGRACGRRHDRSRRPPRHHGGQPLHAGDDLRRVEHLAPEPRGARGAVAAPGFSISH